MGHPPKLRKTYETPKKPFAELDEERKLLREFGLKNKRELWKAETILRRYRRRARELQAMKNEEEERRILKKLNDLGIRVETLDDILKLEVRDILSRRLQTIVYKKGLARTIKQARQFIVHGHVLIGNRKVPFPGFLVPVKVEDAIRLNEKLLSTIMTEKGSGEVGTTESIKTEENPVEKKEETEDKPDIEIKNVEEDQTPDSIKENQSEENISNELNENLNKG
jgi:small subunit ribosomal protein S4